MISSISFWSSYDLGKAECFGVSLNEKGKTCPYCHRLEDCRKEMKSK